MAVMLDLSAHEFGLWGAERPYLTAFRTDAIDPIRTSVVATARAEGASSPSRIHRSLPERRSDYVAGRPAAPVPSCDP